MTKRPLQPQARRTGLRQAISPPVLAVTLAALWTVCASAQVENYHELKYPTLPKFEIPKPAVFTLKNGLQVFLMEDHELPLIRVHAQIRTGSNYEPAEKTGLASLVGAVQRTGG